jgi:hypothetical protein
MRVITHMCALSGALFAATNTDNSSQNRRIWLTPV